MYLLYCTVPGPNIIIGLGFDFGIINRNRIFNIKAELIFVIELCVTGVLGLGISYICNIGGVTIDYISILVLLRYIPGIIYSIAINIKTIDEIFEVVPAKYFDFKIGFN
ncbi:hypothetical protein B0T20DRAFT_389587 [Sordaria brevicollis]|uniref:Uncharacterized protein n=1 Tax=Sordaria brevicollis TaxID=83679 RepID=A0AAE0UEZ1_SORBR|nr:hypothetical protein B0T20DRAFT_389587 [Sordaria brevicollis]